MENKNIEKWKKIVEKDFPKKHVKKVCEYCYYRASNEINESNIFSILSGVGVGRNAIGTFTKENIPRSTIPYSLKILSKLGNLLDKIEFVAAPNFVDKDGFFHAVSTHQIGITSNENITNEKLEYLIIEKIVNQFKEVLTKNYKIYVYQIISSIAKIQEKDLEEFKIVARSRFKIPEKGISINDL